METDLTIERCFDVTRITEILTNPSIWESCSEDGQRKDSFTPEVNADCWLLLSDAEGVIGAINVHPMNSVCLEAHIHILPERRQARSIDAGWIFYRWFVDECPDRYQKLMVKIPSIYQNVRSYVERFGMRLEGTLTSSYLKNGNLTDLWILGISKNEIREKLCQE